MSVQDIMKLPFNMRNLCKVYLLALKRFENIKDKDIVVGIGFTGDVATSCIARCRRMMQSPLAHVWWESFVSARASPRGERRRLR